MDVERVAVPTAVGVVVLAGTVLPVLRSMLGQGVTGRATARAVMIRAQTPFEQRHLLELHGELRRAYLSRVGRSVPGLERRS